MSYKTLLVQKDKRVGVISLNRPERLNGFNSTMVSELLLALADMAEDTYIRVVVLTGNGRAFSAGADKDDSIIVRSTTEVTDRGQTASLLAEIKQAQKIIIKIQEMSKPIIAAINGDAVGAGFGIILACDMRIISETARLGAVLARIGLVPNFGTAYFLSRLVGTAKACQFIFTGDIFDAAEADKLGIVNAVVPPEDLMPMSMQLACRLAEGPPLAMALAKDMVYKESQMSLGDALDYEAVMQSVAMQSADHLEGVKAFREKRKPVFQGR